MRLLYLFPHPDDESFGPAAAISRQLRQGDEVHLLTLTRGGATKQRLRLGLTIEQMGEVRYREMLAMERTLGLTSLTVLDLPDGRLKEMDPRVIERVVAEQIGRVRPEIVITYPVHGISGFHDHLVTHAVVKRVFLEQRDHSATDLKRLAFYTLRAANPRLQDSIHRLSGSSDDEIDCIIEVEQQDIAAMQRALACYATYQQTIADSRVIEIIGNEVPFEIFGERHDPALSDLGEGLRGSGAAERRG